MKKILIITIIALSVLGCEKEFLDNYPNTSSVIENFYRTSGDATQAVTAIYNMMLRDDWACRMLFSEITSDNCAGGSGSGDGGGCQIIDRGLVWTGSDANLATWRNYWGAIFRANVYLEYEGLIDWEGKEPLRLQYQAEARFLRAYYHYYLTTMFGEIPALDHTIAPDEIPARSSAEDLYAMIIEDLEFCVEHGLSHPYPGLPENWGRATKWAAEAMIGRVFLFYTGYYNRTDITGCTAIDARNYIDDVINNSGHDLVDQYASLWIVPTYSELGGDTSQAAYAGEVNPEVVWSVRYNLDGNPDHTFHRMIGPRVHNQDPYGNGWGSIPVLPSLWNAYDTADTRRTATILSWDDEGRTYDYVAGTQAQYTGYNTKKYMLASVGNQPEITVLGGDWQNDGYEDYMVIRFADVLLMGTELYVITAGENNLTALSYVNRVRERAFGNNLHNFTALTVDNILTERRLELACEGQRWWDILRSCKGDFSKLVDILTYVDTNDDGDYSASTDVYSLDVDGNNFVPKKGLFQLPESELDLMEGIIKQNEGYTTE